MGHQHRAIQYLGDGGGYAVERWGVAYHAAGDAVYGTRAIRDRAPRIDERLELVGDLPVLPDYNRHFADAIARQGRQPRGLNIHYRIGDIAEWLVSRYFHSTCAFCG